MCPPCPCLSLGGAAWVNLQLAGRAVPGKEGRTAAKRILGKASLWSPYEQKLHSLYSLIIPVLIALTCRQDKVWNPRLKNRECVRVTVGNKDLFDCHKVAKRQFKLQMVTAGFSFRHLFLKLR